MTVRQLWNRMLAIGLAALPLLIAIWVATGWLYSAHAMLTAQTAETRLTLRRYEMLLARQQEIESAVERARYRARNIYWSGSSEAEVVATIQNQLRTIIDAAGADVQEVEARPPVEHDGHTVVTLHTTVHASPTELLETLYSLESYRPYLFVDHLYVRALEKRTRAEQAQEAVLRASLELRGYLEATDAVARDRR
jgi:hypothetical protein